MKNKKPQQISTETKHINKNQRKILESKNTTAEVYSSMNGFNGRMEGICEKSLVNQTEDKTKEVTQFEQL